MLVVVAWLHDFGIGWLQRNHPNICRRIAAAPLMLRLATGLARLERVSS
jgi:hypothetical protein